MNTVIPDPHDRFFKAAMTNPKVALEFFETHLPESIKKLADLKTLKIQPNSFIDEELRLQMTDMLFSVDWQGKSGYLYTLVEHQRTPDKWIAFRKLKYMLQIMEQHRKEKDELPLVYALIIYNGEQKYRYSTDLFDLFGEHKSLARQNFLEPFYLIDLTQIPDENLKRKSWLGILEMCLKHSYARDMLPLIKNIVSLMREVEQSGGSDYIKMVFHYLFLTGEIGDKQVFTDTIHKHLSPKLEETVMTFAEQLRLEGHQKGRQEGHQEAMQEFALYLLRANKNIEEVIRLTGLSKKIILNLSADINKVH